jgi:hypothetical protein
MRSLAFSLTMAPAAGVCLLGWCFEPSPRAILSIFSATWPELVTATNGRWTLISLPVFASAITSAAGLLSIIGWRKYGARVTLAGRGQITSGLRNPDA